MRLRPLLAAAALATLALAAAPASAELLPLPSQMMGPAELKLLPELQRGEALARDGKTEESLAVLDAVAARMGEGKFKGVLMLNRAGLLERLRRPAEAQAAARDAIRLLPGYSGPLLAGFRIFTFTGRPGEGADLLLRAAASDPAVVKAQVNDLDVQAIGGRLSDAGDEKRLAAVSEALLGLGWTGASLNGRSRLAAEAIAARLKAGRVAEARALVPELTEPAAVYAMLASKTYAPLWGDLEAAAGPKLGRLWAAQLRAAKAAWEAKRSPQSARDYLSALAAADRDRTIAATFAPLFADELDPQRDYLLLYAVAPVAWALGQLGQWDAGLAVFASAARTWPLGRDANALNVTANQAGFLLRAGRAAEALPLSSQSIVVALSSGAQVNGDALQSIYSLHACVLAALGRAKEAGPALAIVARSRKPALRAETALCLGDEAGAKAALIAGLRDPLQREAAIRLLQRPSGPPGPSDYERGLRARWERLRSDPAVLAGLQQWGRVLPYTLSEGAGAE